MYLHRLKIDTNPGNCGFNYDYMGSAEYDFGASHRGRSALAKLVIERNLVGKQVKMIERNPRHVTKEKPAIDVYMFGSQSYIDSLGDTVTINVTKERFGTDDPRIAAWMNAPFRNGDFEPLLIVRMDKKNLERGNKFLQLFVEGILEDEKKAEKQEIHTYANGYTLRRVTGPVLLPQNDGIPIEGDGQWVLFDDTDKAVDRDKYFNDIVERHQRKLGEPTADTTNPSQKSEAYLNGWADASSLNQNKNPHPKGSKEADDYDEGYTMSMQENN